jgi:hypothetical protein
LGYIGVIIIEPFVLVYVIMSPKTLKLVYWCAIVADLLLAVIYLVLTIIAFGQQEGTSFYKGVELAVIPYLILAVIVPGIAAWAAPEKREHICRSIFYEDRNLYIFFPSFLISVTVVIELCIFVMYLFGASSLVLVLVISSIHIGLGVLFLVIYVILYKIMKITDNHDSEQFFYQ